MQKFIVIAFLFSSTLFYSQLQTLTDDFEGNGTILSWYGGDWARSSACTHTFGADE